MRPVNNLLITVLIGLTYYLYKFCFYYIWIFIGRFLQIKNYKNKGIRFLIKLKKFNENPYTGYIGLVVILLVALFYVVLYLIKFFRH